MTFNQVFLINCLESIRNSEKKTKFIMINTVHNKMFGFNPMATF